MISNLFKLIHRNKFQFSVLGNDADTQKFKTLKFYFKTFQPEDKDLKFLTQLYLIFFRLFKAKNIGKKI